MDRGDDAKSAKTPRDGHCMRVSNVVQCTQSGRKERLSTLSNKLFTPDEVAAFKASPYVETATMRTVIFTPEFKKMVYDRIVMGEKIDTVLESYGINTAAMGINRLRGMQEKLEKTANRKEGFEKRKKSTNSEAKESAAADKRLAQLEHEIEYMKQELEFLKKRSRQIWRRRDSWNPSSSASKIRTDTSSAIGRNQRVECVPDVQDCRSFTKGYYVWCKNEPKRIEKEEKDRADFLLILEAYNHRGYDKGAKGIHMRLLHMGIRMNIKKIRRLMKKYGLKCTIRKRNPYKQMMQEMKTDTVSPNLVERQFTEKRPRKVLLIDSVSVQM